MTAESTTAMRTIFIAHAGSAIRFSAPDEGRVIAKALEGIRSHYLARKCDAPEVLDLTITADETQVKFGNTDLRVRHPQGPETFAASVALPLLGIGTYVVGDAEDFFDLLRPATAATFHRLEDTDQLALPAFLAPARGAFLTYFGEGLPPNRLDEMVAAVRERLPAGAPVVVAAAEVPHHRRQVLLTVFAPADLVRAE